MHHKGRQSKPNSPLLLPSDCSSPGCSASPLCAENQDQVGFVGFFLNCHSHRFIASSAKKGTTGIWLKDQTAKCNLVFVLSWLYPIVLIIWSTQKSRFASNLFHIFIMFPKVAGFKCKYSHNKTKLTVAQLLLRTVTVTTRQASQTSDFLTFALLFSTSENNRLNGVCLL